jgi:hypothetical protein
MQEVWNSFFSDFGLDNLLQMQKKTVVAKAMLCRQDNSPTAPPKIIFPRIWLKIYDMNHVSN